MILRHNYTRNATSARGSLRYYQMRPRGEDEPSRAIFGRDRDGMTRDEAGRLLDEHQNGRYLVHRLMLSPGEDEYAEDLTDMTRRAMRELEREHGQRLSWVAVEHHNTEHPHVHVLLAGRGEDDRSREVRLNREDHARVKDAALDYCRTQEMVRDIWEGREREIAREHELPSDRDDDEPGHGKDGARELDRDDDWLP